MSIKNVTEIFGDYVFNDSVMRERLPKNVYKKISKTIEQSHELDPAIADVVANAMKDWAIEKGATHYCHWFQPMTGLTAEKHDSFINLSADGSVIMEFSGKQLIQGEPDASSFPSGGIRATFEARGYTAWDCTSPVFIKKDGDNTTLFIPCAFVSYTGDVLDKKTPLLRSMDALSKEAVRVLNAMGNTSTKRIIATLGAEQEYFLIDESYVEQRLDLIICGRTLFGAQPSKGQDLCDHYFGSIEERIANYMSEINEELWKLGVSAKTQHNEVAPAQYELAPIYATLNVATDHNQLTMEIMQKVARHHGLYCLLHEKPFHNMNGSGKHNNWAIMTNDGVNLLEPGDDPEDNAQFLVFLAAIIKAVDVYAPLLRASVASSSNDCRLGGHEAPPAIISIFLGDQLNKVVESIAKGTKLEGNDGKPMTLGVSTLPPLPKDATDRNRTSPFAFTGNKFEFRMAGSLVNTSGPNFVLNTIVSETLSEIADELEAASDVNVAAQDICQRIFNEHSRVVFNGDNYSAEWPIEAEKRGLPNLKNSPDAYACMADDNIKKLFEKHAVLSNTELAARLEILLDTYAQNILIEGRTALTMANRTLMPAVMEYASGLAASTVAIKESGADASVFSARLDKVNALITEFQAGIDELTAAVAEVEGAECAKCMAEGARDKVLVAMNKTRAAVDTLEEIVDAELWPLPTYNEMLYMRS